MEIEKGVPMPQPKTKGPAAMARDMEVGDSVLLEKFAQATSFVNNGTASSKCGARFMRRKVEGGYRVWRIA